MKNIYNNEKRLLHGGDYNPDQWLDYPDILKDDLRLMKLANVNTMTVGIFAWSALEPTEGNYNFEWLDKIIDDVYNQGGRVILATPSGARPAWLSESILKYLEQMIEEKKCFMEEDIITVSHHQYIEKKLKK